MTCSRNPKQDLPELQTLMAAVIRLMAKCATEYKSAPAHALLKLLTELRAHPDLLRQPAVLAGLAEAHSIWLHQVNAAAEMVVPCVDDESETADTRRLLH